ncbi:MAG: helix-turn-helix transcriptional regulator [Cyanobacteria bacterium SIG27]|nr:helix-turn-helix transcriptional regulator [Cyanobacteria bacterium SIG27]
MQDKFEESKQLLKNALANVVKKHRKKQKKSLSKISAEIMMTKSMWQTLEKGKKDPQYSTIWRVAQALNLTVEDLSKEVTQLLGDDFSLID